MANNKKSFIIHLDSLEILDDLDDKNIAELFRAIRDYNKYGETKLEGIYKEAYTTITMDVADTLDTYMPIYNRLGSYMISAKNALTNDDEDTPVWSSP